VSVTFVRGISTVEGMAQLNVVLMEDHPLYREGLKSYLLSRFPEIHFLYEGADFYTAKEAIASEKVDIAVVDLHLGDGRPPSEIVALFTSKQIPVLVISALNNFESVKKRFLDGCSRFCE